MNRINKPPLPRRWKARSLLILALLILFISVNCTLSEKFADVFIAAWNYLTRSSNDNLSSLDMYEMTATGQLLSTLGPDKEFTENEITLQWIIDQKNGETQPTVEGQGKASDIEAIRSCENHFDLIFIGTVTPDGQDYNGTVQVTAAVFCPDGYAETFNYTSNWSATRRGDLIEGSIDSLGPFRLDVQPAVAP